MRLKIDCRSSRRSRKIGSPKFDVRFRHNRLENRKVLAEVFWVLHKAATRAERI